MINFFKEEERKPFSYSSIEMRKSSKNYIWWILGALILLVIAFMVFHF